MRVQLGVTWSQSPVGKTVSQDAGFVWKGRQEHGVQSSGSREGGRSHVGSGTMLVALKQVGRCDRFTGTQTVPSLRFSMKTIWKKCLSWFELYF